MICSQLVDEAYARAGVQLFDDGRLPGDVTPADLYGLIAAQDAVPVKVVRDMARDPGKDAGNID